MLPALQSSRRNKMHPCYGSGGFSPMKPRFSHRPVYFKYVRGVQSGTGTDLSATAYTAAVSIIPPKPQLHSFIHQKRYIIVAVLKDKLF